MAQAGKMAVATLAMTVVLLAAAWGLGHGDPGWEAGPHGKLRLALEVGGLMALGIGTYIGLSLALGLKELVPARFWPRKASATEARAQVAKASASPYDEG
jgi:hypothetical protein